MVIATRSVLSITIASILTIRSINGGIEPHFNPRSFGVNINSALENPLEDGGSEEKLRRHVARILYDSRMIGATVVRWFVNDVWPQWRCDRDPDDQQLGILDPAWYIVARTLLQEAERQHVKVVIVLSDLAASSMEARAVQMKSWALHREAQTGKDGYGKALPRCAIPNGYYGATQERDLFVDPEVHARFAVRFANMARYLGQFPALGALELFNEPNFELTKTAAFWFGVRDLLAATRGADQRLTGVPVYTGVAWWNAEIVAQARSAGVLADEPLISVHSYDDYTAASDLVSRNLDKLTSFIKRLIPSKAVVIGEVGSSKELRDTSDNRKMFAVIMEAFVRNDVGMWVWGDWFAQPDTGDYRWTFNHRSPVGDSFRRYFFSADKEAEYEGGKEVLTADGRRITFRTGRIANSDHNPVLRLRYYVLLDGIRYIGFSRSGLFARPQSRRADLFGTSPPTFLLTDLGVAPGWSSIEFNRESWMLHVFRCDADGLERTPDELIELAGSVAREDFDECRKSRKIFSARL